MHSARTLNHTRPPFRLLIVCEPSIVGAVGTTRKARTMKEVWKSFAGGNYAVSSNGRVKRLTPGMGTKPGRILKLNLMKIGYYRCAPVVDGRCVHMYVHRIVADTFLGSCPSGKEVHHKDGDPTNNRVDNLEYITHAENIRHGYENKLGENHHSAKLTDQQAREIRSRRLAGERGVDLAREFNISQPTICDILKGRSRCQCSTKS